MHAARTMPGEQRRLAHRLARDKTDIAAVQRLRCQVFCAELGANPGDCPENLDADPFDALCDHLLVIDTSGDEDGAVVGTYRLLCENVASRAGGFYSAGEFDIRPLGAARASAPARIARAAGVVLAAAFVLAASEPVVVTMRLAADEARQGAAADGRHAYAIDNSRIGKYRISDGRRVAQWSGDPERFPHINSCAVDGRVLACAMSNYPQLPQTSSVEMFDARTLRHLRSHSFGIAEGSLTTIDRFGSAWWAVFAHYDGKGGVPGKDAAHSQFVRLDDQFRVTARWTFPREVVERMRHFSISGASWSNGGRLALSGHSRPEIYLVSLPSAGSVLALDAIVPVATEGQAIAWDPVRPSVLWTISRTSRELVSSDLAQVARR